jgi:outer membrane lipoprotein-sorting protein
MNMYKHTLTILLTILFATVSMPVFALDVESIDAHQVAVNVDERDDGDDMTSSLEMTLINKRGQERVRKVTSYRKDYGEDDKMVMFFLEPADVKGTGFLTWNYDDESKDDDQWLYLPALKKVRRISSSKKADYFMGTDFTYSDMGDREIEDYTYTHLEPEVIDGIECYHLERLPKDEDVMKETGYGRTEIWVNPNNWVMVKAVFYDKKLKLLKELTTSDIEEIDGIWTVKTMKMNNVQKEHQTIFKFSDITYNSGLDDDIFSQRRLTQGIK